MPDRHDEIFRALGDRHRRQILAALCREPMVAGDLARLAQLAPNALSFHLKWLRSAGLVDARRHGKYLSYRALPGALTDWQDHLTALFRPAETPPLDKAGAEGAIMSPPLDGGLGAVLTSPPLAKGGRGGVLTSPTAVSSPSQTRPRPPRQRRPAPRRPVAPQDEVLPTELL